MLAAVKLPPTVVAPKINAPVLVTTKLPLTVTAPKVNAAVLVIAALLLLPAVLNNTVPRKLLLFVNIIAAPVAPELKLALPVPLVMVVTPLCVMAPLLITVKVPAAFAIETVPNSKLPALVIAMLLAPVLVNDTKPVN